MIEIKNISARETYAVRQPVLRPGKPVESCHFDGDDSPGTTHFGYFENGHLIGIASLFASRSDLFAEQNQLQLRGMAVLAGNQKKGIGESLLRKAEQHAANDGIEIIWFNARELAVGFYEKNGYAIKGKAFNITGIGTHFVMFKSLCGNR